jgi:hypothetical protein
LSVTPGQEFIKTSNLVVGSAAENVGEPGLRIDAVEFCRFDGVVTLSEIGTIWTINQQAKSLKTLA